MSSFQKDFITEKKEVEQKMKELEDNSIDLIVIVTYYGLLGGQNQIKTSYVQLDIFCASHHRR